MYTAAITNSVHFLSEAMISGNWIWVIPELSKRIILMSRQGDLLYDRNYISVNNHSVGYTQFYNLINDQFIQSLIILQPVSFPSTEPLWG